MQKIKALMCHNNFMLQLEKKMGFQLMHKILHFYIHLFIHNTVIYSVRTLTLQNFVTLETFSI